MSAVDIRSNAPNKMERPWRSLVSLPGEQSGILIVQTGKPRRPRQWYRLKNFAALWGLEHENAYQWLKDGTIPRRLTKRARQKYTVIHRAAIPLIEQLLGRAANQPETRR